MIKEIIINDILLVGDSATGKSLRLRETVKETQAAGKKAVFLDISVPQEISQLFNHDVVAIDSVNTIEQLYICLYMAKQINHVHFVIATSLDFSELPKHAIDYFEIHLLNFSYRERRKKQHAV